MCRQTKPSLAGDDEPLKPDDLDDVGDVADDIKVLHGEDPDYVPGGVSDHGQPLDGHDARYEEDHGRDEDDGSSICV
jgi:hypothetical protein